MSVTANVAGLSPKTGYHFRIIATSFAGTSEGSDGAFTTLKTSPCPWCSGYAPVVSNVIFQSGTDCECSGTRSITIGPNVTIESGARVTFKAPEIKVRSGFHAEEGAVVNMRRK